MEESIKICVTCLSTDRRLVPVLTLSALLQEIKFEELKESSGEVCWECWSILVKFYKFKKRAKMAHETLSKTMEHSNIKSLTTLTKTNIIFSEYDYIYNFNYVTNVDHISIKEENPDHTDDDIDQIYDHFNHIEETLDIDENLIAKPQKNKNVHSEDDIIENKYNINMLVKQENSLEDIPIIFNETGQPSEHTEELETVDTKPTKKLLRTTVKSQKKDFKKISQIAIKDIDDKEFEEKFLQVVLTEEEVLQGREERRNHPSFRTLPFICNGCLLGFRKEVKYRIHMEKKHDESIGNFTCNICAVRFPHNLALNKHKRKHYVVYRCKLCRYQGNDLRSAVNHCKIKHAADKPDSIHCLQCKFVAKNSQDLERHMEMEHKFWCNECGEKFTLKRNIRIHLTRTHAPLRAFKCDICKKGFKTNAQLESHLARHNESIAKKLSYCEECCMQFKTIVIYRSHLKNTAHHSKGYSCSKCDKTFKGKSYLKQHYDFHHLHRSRYKCEVCNKTFMSKSALNIHKAGHLGKDRPRNFSCNICSKKFFSSSVLHNHQLTHTDERKFMCEDCGDTFKQKACLFTHTRLKHKGWRKRKRES